MLLPDVKEKWTSAINQVVIGATKDQGGTRAKTITVGGQTTLPFMTFEGQVPNRPVIAGFVADTVPDWPDVLKNAIGKEINSPVQWAQKCVEQYGVDLISLKLLGADPSGKDASASDCTKVVKDVLAHFKAHPRHKLFGLNPDDAHVYWCECPGCRGTSASDRYIRRNGF